MLRAKMSSGDTMTADELKAGLEATGLSRNAIARAIGRSKRSVQRYLAGTVTIDGPVSIALRQALGASPAPSAPTAPKPARSHKVRSKVARRRARK